MRMYHRLALMLRDIITILQHHSQEEKVEILTGAGIYHKDGKSHVHVKRDNAGHDT